MRAYLVNDHYIFTNYDDLSSHVHDVIHYTVSELEGSHFFYVLKGEVYWEKGLFISESGDEIPIQYEYEDDFYSCTKVYAR